MEYESKVVSSKARMTKQRRLILKIVRSTKNHPNATWIYDQAREKIPDISLGTVYRNLQFLVKEDLIKEIKESGLTRFDGNMGHHYHFICTACGEVLDVDMPVRQIFNEEVTKAIPGKIDFHKLDFFGICDSCQQEHAEA